MEELISVIVPIYNVEEYLQRCIDSIINQTYSNLEIILVDDGSPDKCGEICDEYARKDSRVKVMHKKNGGVASARNAGLDLATGSYVSFVDSDDYIDKNLYKLLKDAADEYKADITCSGFIDCYVDSGTQVEKNPSSKTLIFEGDSILDNYYGEFNSHLTVPWGKLYKKIIFENLRYENMIYEDSNIFLKIINRVKNVAYISFSGYFYQKRNQGLVNGKIKKSMVESLDKLCKNRIEDIYKYFPQFLYKEVALRLTDIGSIFRRCKDKELKIELRNMFVGCWKKYKKFLKFKYKRTLKCYIYRIYIAFH